MEVYSVKWPAGLPAADAALTAPPPPVTSTQAEMLSRAAFALAPTHVRPLPGERDRNFHVRTEAGAYILKVAHPAEPADVSDLQAAALRHLEAADPTLAVPRVVPSRLDPRGAFIWDDEGRRPRQIVRCVTFVEGRSLGHAPADAERRAAVGLLLARVDVALAGFRHPADGRSLLWDAHRAPAARPLVAAIAEPSLRGVAREALDRFDQAVLPRLPALRRQVIHNDFNPQNVLVSPRGDGALAGVIDFGDVVRAPLVQDLATVCAYQACEDAHPLQAAAQITRAYHAACPVADAELEVLPDLIAGRLVLSAAISSWRALREPDNRRYLLRNLPLVGHNLERLMAVPAGEGAEWLSDRVAAAS